MKNYNLIFDFDSTLVQCETLEIIAKFALNEIQNKNDTLIKISEMTTLAMRGDMSFPLALKKRVELLKIKKEYIHKTIEFMNNKLTTSFHSNLFNFKKNMDKCFIISGGFKEVIIPTLIPYGFKKENIYANSFIFDDNQIAHIDSKNVLAMEKGKNLVADKINGENIIIGDGYTDYELKKFGNATKFILFTENIFRKELKNKADFIANNFDEVFKYLDS